MAEHEEGPRQRSSKLVLAALRAELAGFEVQDKDVELSSGDATLRADWVGTERAGRIVVAAWHEERDDAAIVWAVEAVAFARRLDAQDPAGRKGRAPAGVVHKTLAALIVPRCSERLRAALAPLPQESFALFELREAGGRGARGLVRCDLAGSSGSGGGGFDAWPAGARALAESLAARVPRIDRALERDFVPIGIVWRRHGEECASLSFSSGQLVGGVPGGGNLQSIADEAGGEAWLERVLRAHCARLRSGIGAARPLDLVARGGPLLTPEELEAFRA